MEITTIELRKLTANEGMILTNGETYGKEIYLGINDSALNWIEMPDIEIPEQEPILENEII